MGGGGHEKLCLFCCQQRYRPTTPWLNNLMFRNLSLGKSWVEGRPATSLASPLAQLYCFSLNPLWSPPFVARSSIQEWASKTRRTAQSKLTLPDPKSKGRRPFFCNVFVGISRIVWRRTKTANACRGFVKQLGDRVGPIHLVRPDRRVSYLLLDVESIALQKPRRRYSRTQLSAFFGKFSRSERRSRWCVLFNSLNLLLYNVFVYFLEYLHIIHFEWIQKYGPLYRLWAGFRPVVLISTPELMEVCQQTIYILDSSY